MVHTPSSPEMSFKHIYGTLYIGCTHSTVRIYQSYNLLWFCCEWLGLGMYFRCLYGGYFDGTPRTNNSHLHFFFTTTPTTRAFLPVAALWVQPETLRQLRAVCGLSWLLCESNQRLYTSLGWPPFSLQPAVSFKLAFSWLRDEWLTRVRKP